jgi:2-dehydro-3-deoxy-D-gluconate 5-dehydrogenase
MFDLSGKLALVTGCRRGIGLATAEALARAGADVVGTSLDLPEGQSEARARVEAAGRSFVAYQADLGTRDGAANLARSLERDGRSIDILVSNAGTIRRAAAVDQTDAMWAEVIQTNLTSGFVLARELGRRMVERGRGKIVFTASLLSFQGGINVASYTAAKSGLVGIVRALSNEWASQGVNVNAIAPGYIATDNTQALRDDPERCRAILERIPAARWGEPGDLAGAMVFLASAASDYVNGIVLPVDGGWLGR